ncbi:bis(5'-adenosyl)-triphosphatase enpp4-like [Brevipalpus obovatus]|uniref:bis(5'-adenosyl)-triphosphatase enpp4-like n=1 Tax=Brevipalpus obovatus TaxID=246614 RepID=UPI003D9E4014
MLNTRGILVLIAISVAVLSVVLVATCLILFESESSEPNGKYLIVVSLDGFRPDYINETITPNLWKLKREGSFGKMKPMFTSLTFPNHMSIATGLHEEIHGVVSNTMYDPKYHEFFQKTNDSYLWWDSGYSRPIWVANQILSKKGHSATIMWPGCMSTYSGYHSDYQIGFKSSSSEKEMIKTYENHAKQIIEWMKDDQKPANLVLMYLAEPDQTSHAYPPFSDEVWHAVGLADQIVGILLNKLIENNLYKSTNLMVVSDHGMATINESLDLSKTTDMSLYSVEKASTAVLNVWPNEGKLDQVYEMFDKLASEKPFKVYRRDEIPERFRYRHHRRIGELVLVADDHLELCVKCWTKPGKTWGNHGYDNDLMDLRALFLGHGPDFQVDFEQNESFYNVDLYPLMMRLTNLPRDPRYKHNGTFSVTKKFLRQSLQSYEY